MLKRFALVGALAVLSTAAQAQTVDWTPYLKSLQASCEQEPVYTLLSKKLPASLQKSVVNKTGKLSEHENNLTLVLKNASVFGYPLTKIRYHGDYYAPTITLHFANADFMKIAPSFYVNDGVSNHYVGTEKNWLVEGTPVEQGDKTIFKVYRTINLSKAESRDFWDYEKGLNEDAYRTREDSSFNGYSVSAIGYVYGHSLTNTQLTFDKKNRTISCSDYFE